ncbi:ribulose-1,5 bisphosphate carboxylase/oxygenase large subunit N-methyltransferase, chloroplastic-like isoform X2 [Cornus florida]|uniref:ribulose-1,5 bisphosphate carboxylase/oxygenase large subunit N-methyltransferase, chloroplastic-like isoform X2 n=1 Tax=Cornus florida TaxID=4283 RepID=UPI0028A070F1|nr:ribulose-1,5 bisphosphate carboxylase/oxygenase large subunit N-methyltransferase, chloroplastic-like isoform X2 [Cornus florida]
MATLLALYSSSSSAFLAPVKTLKNVSFLKAKKTLHFERPLSVNSLLSSESDPLPPAVQTFWQWLREEGVVYSETPVKPGVVPEGLGLVAQRDIAENEVVLKVPRRLWINPETVSASEIGDVCNGLKPWVSVSLFLIREKLRDDSLWRYYFDILPQYTNSTLYWSEEELSEIQGTQLLSTTLAVKEYVKSEFQKVEEKIILPHKHLFQFPITLGDFFWAFGILRSRAFSLHGPNLVVIPLVDLINHSSSITTEDHASEIEGPAGLFSWDLLFCLRSPVSVKAGKQIFIQYALNKSNARLAFDYGFIESRSDRNAYTLTLEISDSDPFFGDKVDIAKSNGLGKTADFDINLDHSLPPALLPYLRLVVLQETDAFLMESLFRNSIWGHLEFPVSRANEEIVCQVVRNACKSALSGYRTTIEEELQTHR